MVFIIFGITLLREILASVCTYHDDTVTYAVSVVLSELVLGADISSGKIFESALRCRPMPSFKVTVMDDRRLHTDLQGMFNGGGGDVDKDNENSWVNSLQ